MIGKDLKLCYFNYFITFIQLQLFYNYYAI